MCSFGVSSVPLYLTLIILCFALVMFFECFLKRFPKQRYFQSIFLKDRDSVILHVACCMYCFSSLG